jgi:hypothetical protein
LSAACKRLAILELLTELWLELGAVWALRVTAPPVISPETAAVIRRDFTVFFVICDSFSIEIGIVSVERTAPAELPGAILMGHTTAGCRRSYIISAKILGMTLLLTFV